MSSGENGISVKYSGSSTNLHSAWGECRKRTVNTTPVHVDDDGLLHPFLDTGIVTKNTNAHYGDSSQIYASALATRITVKLTHRLVSTDMSGDNPPVV